MYLHPVFYISLLSLSPSITLANPQPPLQPLVTYSTWMLESIISRQQGIANSGAATGQIELGIFQDALQQIIFWKGIPDSTQTEQWSDYLDRSVRSGLSSLLNATRDALYPLDRLSLGNALLHLYNNNGNQTYYSAISALRESIDLQPRNALGGYWYYSSYRNWSYLDGMYSLSRFSLPYTFILDLQDATAAASDLTYQLDLLWDRCHSNDTGFLVHGYDASKTAVWANPVTGASPNVWGRSLGWYSLALVNTLEKLPGTHQSALWQRQQSHFQALADAIASAADPVTGGWWQLMNFPGREGNYIESSASAMFTYALLKGVRLGFLRKGINQQGKNASVDYIAVANKAYEYILEQFVVVNKNNTLSYNGTVGVCSLNSTASYEYYISQPIVYNSLIGSSAFILASLEHETWTQRTNSSNDSLQSEKEA